MEIEKLLRLMVDKTASDLFITAGMPPSMKVHGRIHAVTKSPLSPEQTKEVIYGMMSQSQIAEFEEKKELNFAVSASGVGRWNRILNKAGIDFELTVPHKAFNRNIGPLAGLTVSPEGRVVSQEQWQQSQSQWLPTPEDRAFVQSLMGRVTGQGQYANYIAPPAVGINKQPMDFDYVRFN